jgi:hypothetical protein
LALVPKYRIRWRYDWTNRAPKMGMWSLTTKNEIDQAWNKNKEGLLWASVEGKPLTGGEPVTLVQCMGQDFCFFQWIAMASMPALGVLTQKKPFTPITRLVGIKVVTRYEVVSVYDTGHIFREPRTKEDMSYNYAAFGK